MKSKSNKDDKQKIMLDIKTITKYNTEHWNKLKSVAIAHNYVWEYDTYITVCQVLITERRILIKGIKIFDLNLRSSDSWTFFFYHRLD